MRSIEHVVSAAALVIVVVAGGICRADGQPAHSHPPGTPPHEHPPAPARITMEDLHRSGGVPPGWRFTMPPGDPKEGRVVFVKLECFTCHAVRDEAFPSGAKSAEDVGPDLTGMGSHHPAEYFAEAIMNPNAVIVTGPGYVGQDGFSRMPDYTDVLTGRQLIDLVAYLKSLSGGDHAMPTSHGTPPARGGHAHPMPGPVTKP